MWHKPCRTFHPWCLYIKTRCLLLQCAHNITLITIGSSRTIAYVMELHVSNFRRAIMKNRWITNGPVLRNSRAFNEDIHKGNRRQHYVRDREPLCTDLPGVIHKTCCWLTYIYIPNVELHSNMAPLQKGQSPLTHPTTLTQWRPVTHICVAELDHRCFRYQLCRLFGAELVPAPIAIYFQSRQSSLNFRLQFSQICIFKKNPAKWRSRCADFIMLNFMCTFKATTLHMRKVNSLPCSCRHVIFHEADSIHKNTIKDPLPTMWPDVMRLTEWEIWPLSHLDKELPCGPLVGDAP